MQISYKSWEKVSEHLKSPGKSKEQKQLGLQNQMNNKLKDKWMRVDFHGDPVALSLIDTEVSNVAHFSKQLSNLRSLSTRVLK